MQVYRELDAGGRISRDSIGLVDERLPGQPLLEPAMRDGHRLAHPSLDRIRQHAAREPASLPEPCRRIAGPVPVVPTISPALAALTAAVDRAFP